MLLAAAPSKSMLHTNRDVLESANSRFEPDAQESEQIFSPCGCAGMSAFHIFVYKSLEHVELKVTKKVSRYTSFFFWNPLLTSA